MLNPERNVWIIACFFLRLTFFFLMKLTWIFFFQSVSCTFFFSDVISVQLLLSCKASVWSLYSQLLILSSWLFHQGCFSKQQLKVSARTQFLCNITVVHFIVFRAILSDMGFLKVPPHFSHQCAAFRSTRQVIKTKRLMTLRIICKAFESFMPVIFFLWKIELLQKTY